MNQETVWRATAPSNIALIKYMGKTSHEENRPSNGSLSYSLDYLRTAVEIVPSNGKDDSWEPLNNPEYPTPPQLSYRGMERFLNHFKMLKEVWQIEGIYCVRSANNFPSDCGLASSASSFAALTLAAAELARDKRPEIADQLDVKRLSELSRKGSGSSCRSLFSSWALWQSEGAAGVEFPVQNLLHQAVIVEAGKKEVSSSEAHRRVVTSPHFSGRVERAESRLKKLTEALNKRDWRTGFEVCWDEFQDMHQLFETSEPAFSYMTESSRQVLKHVFQYWENNQDGPWVTMDAGANVHLLYRDSQRQMAEELKADLSAYGQVIGNV